MGILGEVAVKPLALEACGVVKDLAANYELPKFDEGFLSSLGNDEAAEFFGCTLQAANNWRLYLRFGQQVQASPKAYIDLGDGVWHQLDAKNLPPSFRQLTSLADCGLYLKNNELQLEQLASGDVGLSVVAAKLPAMELPKHKLNELIQQWQRLQTLNVAELTSLSSYLTTTNPELERALALTQIITTSSSAQADNVMQHKLVDLALEHDLDPVLRSRSLSILANVIETKQQLASGIISKLESFQFNEANFEQDPANRSYYYFWLMLSQNNEIVDFKGKIPKQLIESTAKILHNQEFYLAATTILNFAAVNKQTLGYEVQAALATELLKQELEVALKTKAFGIFAMLPVSGEIIEPSIMAKLAEFDIAVAGNNTAIISLGCYFWQYALKLALSLPAGGLEFVCAALDYAESEAIAIEVLLQVASKKQLIPAAALAKIFNSVLDTNKPVELRTSAAAILTLALGNGQDLGQLMLAPNGLQAVAGYLERADKSTEPAVITKLLELLSSLPVSSYLLNASNEAYVQSLASIVAHQFLPYECCVFASLALLAKMATACKSEFNLGSEAKKLIVDIASISKHSNINYIHKAQALSIIAGSFDETSLLYFATELRTLLANFAHLPNAQTRQATLAVAGSWQAKTGNSIIIDWDQLVAAIDPKGAEAKLAVELIKSAKEPVTSLGVSEFLAKLEQAEQAEKAEKTQKAADKVGFAPAKTLDLILSELTLKNQDNAELLQLISELDLMEYFALLHKAGEQASILFVQAKAADPTFSDNHKPLKPLNNWNESEVQQWAELVRSNKEFLQTKAGLAEALSVIGRATELSEGYRPREVQIIAVLLLLQATQHGRLLEVATGEGKSQIVAMFSVLKALVGSKVDIVTSSTLPQRA